MKCCVCGSEVWLRVDGVYMSEENLLRLQKVPKKIERGIYHKEWCDSKDHKMQLMSRR